MGYSSPEGIHPEAMEAAGQGAELGPLCWVQHYLPQGLALTLPRERFSLMIFPP